MNSNYLDYKFRGTILFRLYEQAEAQGFNALTTYIFVCMVFIAIAMLYYGLMIFKLQRFNKIEDEKGAQQMSNSIIKLDRLMLVAYVMFFLIFNVYYFISNLA